MPDDNVTYYAVFADVTVFADEALTIKICDLVAGTALPAVTGSRGYALADGISFDGPATYQISLNAFSAECGGNDSGYIGVSQTEVFGTHTWLVPIIDVSGRIALGGPCQKAGTSPAVAGTSSSPIFAVFA